MLKSCTTFFNGFRLLCVSFTVVMMSKSSGSGQFPEYQNKDDVEALSKSQINFTRDLYLTLAKENEGNLFFSPFSIAAAMGMVHMGTSGNTEEEMKKVLHFPDDKESIQRAFYNLIKDFQQEAPEYELRTSNMMYIGNKFKVADTFFKTLLDSFLTSAKTVDFSNEEPIRTEINTAVEKETNSKIKNLIPQGVLNPSTAMVLVNAIYFKGFWLHKFDPAVTSEKPFWITAEESVSVPMMTIEEKFRIADKTKLDARLLAMDYQGGRLSFVILLPNRRDGLAALEEKLADEDLALLDKDTYSQKVKVTLPKFKLEESLNLKDTLLSMGIKDLFSPSNCNLSGISGKNDIYVSHALHKAFIEVNEEGSEAAAATAVIAMARAAVLRPPRPFVADHTFLFYILDKASDTILFMGRFANPAMK